MTSENQKSDPYAAALADLRAKRAKIDNTIRVLEELSGLRLSPDAEGELQFVPATPPDNGGIVETAGAFLGMSIVAASKKLLAMRKRTMSNPEIARELQAGGLVLTSAEPANVIGSVLTRRFNQVGDVVKVGRGIWGLKEWYPGRTFKPVGKNIVMVTPSADGMSESGEGVRQGDAPPESGPGSVNMD